MAKYILSFLLIFALTSSTFNMEVKKDKVRFKKGTILVNKAPWCKYERTGGKYFYSTLDGTQYLSVNGLSYGTGEYYKGGKGGKENIEKKRVYSELHFMSTEIVKFEVDLVHKRLVRALINEGVIENGVFNLEKAKKFKTKYEDNISEKRFLTK